MLGSEIKLLIVDFDGTLVDTFRANFMAYQEAFNQVGLALKEVDYRHCFGFRFEKFMATVGITDPVVTQKISEFKGNCYPDFFRYFKVNNSLLAILKTFHNAGGKTAIASTACRKNLEKQKELGIYDAEQKEENRRKINARMETEILTTKESPKDKLLKEILRTKNISDEDTDFDTAKEKYRQSVNERMQRLFGSK
jgi:3-deoxy-D-manno-octulosonate 8-phosphate phosphatase KdsC-like HAD superfamily phosphatase